MRLITAISAATALFLAVPAYAYNIAPSLGVEAAVSGLNTRLGTSFVPGPTCLTRVLAAEDTTPLRTERITCLNELCTTREVVLCVYSD